MNTGVLSAVLGLVGLLAVVVVAVVVLGGYGLILGAVVAAVVLADLGGVAESSGLQD